MVRALFSTQYGVEKGFTAKILALIWWVNHIIQRRPSNRIFLSLEIRIQFQTEKANSKYGCVLSEILHKI